MTRIAVITDAHANLPALEAVLGAIQDLRCNAIYHTGDAVGAGPFPAEVLDRLLHTSGVRLLMGNHDELCAFGVPDPQPGWMDDALVANARWTQAQVDPDIRAAMASWPYVLKETIAHHHYAFLHYPRDPDGNGFVPIVEDAIAEDLDDLFAGVRADVMFYGHHHPAVDETGRARYVNPGSLGCGEGAVARFTIIDGGRSGTPVIEHHAARYNRAPLHAALVRRDVPDAEFLRRAFFP